MNYDRQFYENDKMWDEQSPVNIEMDRIKFTYDLIPSDIKSVLDVGCGNGLFLNYILSDSGKHFRLLEGIDTSKAALKYVKTQKKLASADKIPYESGSFDIVTALEVIEHLSVVEFTKALKEISRVSNKYILVSVPYRQNLKEMMVLCPLCKSSFNIAHHKRSFDEKSIEVLFKDHGYKNVNTAYFGRVEKMLLLTKAFSAWKNIYTPPIKINTPCPVCGYQIEATASSDKRSKVFQKIKSMAKVIRPIWPKTYAPKWIFGLYLKN